MNSKKDEAISQIMAEFEDLANLVLKQISLLDELVTDDSTDAVALVAEIEANEKKLDKTEVKISDHIVNTITLYQPVASDIRKLVACYRIVISLERVGDIVLNITKRFDKVKGTPVFADLLDAVTNMLMQAATMVKKALLAFTNDDRDYAIWTIKNDAMVDQINQNSLKKVIKKTRADEIDKTMLSNFMEMKSMISNIERIADHATNIAEAAIYSIEGKEVRHKKNIE